ncbi:MAG: hypothetical protein KDA36_03375 [Planctomycetaceae bacterium]|nr:hypothetical protein [Planctomycetaceae bacterium]
MASLRAGDVAEILWELKSANKLAACTEVARRAGFRSGLGGKAVLACMKLVRRDWPHLQWWRIVQDGGLLEDGSEQIDCLLAAGYEVEKKKRQGRRVILIKEWEASHMEWEEYEEELDLELDTDFDDMDE